MKNRGFSLIELLVVLFLMGTVSALVLAIFVPSLSLWKSQQASSDVQNAAMLASARLEQRLLNAQMDSLTIDPMGKFVAYQQTIEGAGGFDVIKGNPILESQVHILFADQSNRQIRETLWTGQPTLNGIDFNSVANHLVRLSSANVNQILSGNPQSRVLGHLIEQFQISDSDAEPGLITLPLVIKVQCKLTLAQSAKQESFETVLKVNPRSQSL